jgi:hypothetical protein
VRVAKALFEAFALFAALALIMPYIPSHEGFVHAFDAKGWAAVAFFGAGRAVRWGKWWWIAIPEAAAFGVFAWALVMSYNLL